MCQDVNENTLFLGNGFLRSIIYEMPSWEELFREESTPEIGGIFQSSNFTFIYEAARLCSNNKVRLEDSYKNTLIQRIRDAVNPNNIQTDVNSLKTFGIYLFANNINNIVTTNYDNTIEYILCNLCDYGEEPASYLIPERIYSIRTHKVFTNIGMGHSVKLWKIHGDFDRVKSVTLGFDQYCGSLSKLIDYVKGSYKSSQSPNAAKCNISMKDKCDKQSLWLSP